MLRNQDLNLLPIFAMLMQEQHLSKAALRLNMSQPAVSNALKRLRQSFGDPLFVRTGRGLKPTQRAQELYASLNPALSTIRDSFEGANRDLKTQKRTVELTMNHAVEYIWGPSLMAAARASVSQKTPSNCDFALVFRPACRSADGPILT